MNKKMHARIIEISTSNAASSKSSVYEIKTINFPIRFREIQRESGHFVSHLLGKDPIKTRAVTRKN